MDLVEKLSILSDKIELLVSDRENLKNENKALRKRVEELEERNNFLNNERTQVREKIENLLTKIG